ncbi:hypothetical protein [uncultured Gammaproteobacteria bacterium]|nr:hypothetical protein [uncultured Gammaproteobacteria bacterium]
MSKKSLFLGWLYSTCFSTISGAIIFSISGGSNVINFLFRVLGFSVFIIPFSIFGSIAGIFISIFLYKINKLSILYFVVSGGIVGFLMLLFLFLLTYLFSDQSVFVMKYMPFLVFIIIGMLGGSGFWYEINKRKKDPVNQIV